MQLQFGREVLEVGAQQGARAAITNLHANTVRFTRINHTDRQEAVSAGREQSRREECEQDLQGTVGFQAPANSQREN